MNNTNPADDDNQHRSLASSGILIPLTAFFGTGLIGFIVFCFVRTVFTDIYSPRRALSRCRPPHLPNSLFSWVNKILGTPESLLINTVGLDGVMLLRFLRMGMILFSILSVLGLTILLPVNYYAKEPATHDGGIFNEIRLLRQLTVENVPQESPYLKAHLLFTWIFSFIAYYFLIVYYKNHVKLKLNYQEYLLRKSHLSKIEMRTVMVYGIPTQMRDEISLKNYFDSLDIGKVESVALCRKFTLLKNAVMKRAFYLQQMEHIYVQTQNMSHTRSFFNMFSLKFFTRSTSVESEPLLRTDRFGLNDADPSVSELLNVVQNTPPRYKIRHRLGFMGLFGPLVDSSEYYSERYKIWDRKVQQLRRGYDASSPTSVGFITFESPEAALIASQINIASKPFMLMTRRAPEPRDLYWKNISSPTADPILKLICSMIVYSAMIFMVFFNTIAVSAIASLIDLDSLARLFVFLKDFIANLSPVTRQIVQGVIPTAVLSFWTSSMPSMLYSLSQFQGLEAISWIEMSVMSKFNFQWYFFYRIRFFFYQLWNILLVVVSSTIFKSSAWPIQTPKDIIEILGNSLPHESPTLINYVMLQALASFPLQLLQVGPLIITWITRLAPWSNGTARQRSDAYAPSTLTSINYGTSYSVPMLLFVIGLTYAPIAPLILPFCTLFFAVGYFVYKYLLLYVHVPQYETGGLHAPMVVRRLLLGMFLMQLTMMGVLALKSVPANERDMIDKHLITSESRMRWSGYVAMVLAVMPLLIITTALFWWFKHGYEREVTHLPMDLVSKVARSLEKAKRKNQEISTEEGNPGQSRGPKELRKIPSRLKVEEHVVKRKNSLRGSIRDYDISAATIPTDDSDGTLLSMTNLTTETNLFEMDMQGEEPLLSDVLGQEMREEHLEMPMSKVPGILDVSLESSIPVIPDKDEDDFVRFFSTRKFDVSESETALQGNFGRGCVDLQVYSYLHPALIGRLPVAWYKGCEDKFITAREEQGRNQFEIWRRVVGVQRLGVVNEQNEIEDDEEGEFDVIYGVRSGRANRKITDRIKSVIEGISSWVNLQNSS